MLHLPARLFRSFLTCLNLASSVSWNTSRNSFVNLFRARLSLNYSKPTMLFRSVLPDSLLGGGGKAREGGRVDMKRN